MPTSISGSQIAFASFGEGGRGAGLQPFAAYASVDISDRKAVAALKRIASLTSEHGILSEGAHWASPDLKQFLTAIEERALVTTIDKRAIIVKCVVGLLLDPIVAGTRETTELRAGLKTVISARLTSSKPGGYALEVRRLDTILSERKLEAFVVLLAGLPEIAEKLAALLAENRASILAHWDRFRPACSLLSLIDAKRALRTFRDHCAAWGRIHRLITPVCVEGQAVDALSCFEMEHAASEISLEPEAPLEGYWEAWRPTTLVRAYSASESPALRLASTVAQIAARTVSERSEDAATLRSWVKRHHYGWEIARIDVAVTPARDRPHGVQEPSSPLEAARDTLHAARAIDSAALLARRDRLFIKMSEHAANIATLTKLRVENLHLVGGLLYEGGNDKDALSIELDEQGEQDFWELARRIEGMSGWLFAPVETQYGRMSLTDQEALKIIADHVIAAPG